ncbi:hypothetical protein Pyrfu_1529 [Pyrolobus fumarii 1A]|uniref:Uncharacterized protein n=1 Tax=Pyrolobus fumarii (strain DSM 11204 / 1A) TaxID=694429 RepID=G0EHN3_PYRF1|nr:hypothetical protein Pyrfu_1529 [Pyrolobus fumarii 1A]
MLFAAVRAAMRGDNELREALEMLALRLDLLASLDMPVTLDPEVERIIRKIGNRISDGLEWVMNEVCDMLKCMGLTCKPSGGTS